MANTQCIVDSFRSELLSGIHAFGTTVVRIATTVDSFKAALYFASATINAATTIYTTTGEVTNAAGTAYTAGGVAVTNATAPSTSASVGIWTPSGAFAWTTASFTAFDTVLLYNSTQGNKAVAVFTFGSQTVSAGNFTLNMPTHASATALLRLA